MALQLCGKRILSQLRTPQLLSHRFNGYIVLVPEIGEDSPAKNPLLQNDGLPEFNTITIENCMAAISKQTLDFEAGVNDIEKSLGDNTDVFKDVIHPLEELGSPLDLTWGLSKTLYLGNSILMPTKHYLAIHNRAMRARATKFNSPKIFQTIKNELEKNVERNDEDERLLQKFVLEGKLNGLELTAIEKIEFERISKKLTMERGMVKHKIDQATGAFSYLIKDNAVVRNFPMELLEMTSVDRSDPMKGPWQVTLEPYVYKSIMDHCPDRMVRLNTWQAHVGRGSGYGNKNHATGIHLDEIRYARRDLAKLLGYESYAHMSNETKMANSVEEVMDMLEILRQRAKPAQDEELRTLLEFALERDFKGDRIELWDLGFWRRKQQRSVYGYQEENFKDYFPLPKVLEGLFQLCEKLFGIIIKQRAGVSVWHADVKFYDVFESHSSAPIAGFYVDPYARSDEKIRLQRSNGWMVGIQNQSRISETKPLAALVFNFDPPSGDRQSHLSFEEVKSVFKKFGLTLQHLLTRTNYSEVSGLSNMQWDVVEVTGHVMSHWLLNKDVIDSISCHYESEDKLPPRMFQSLVDVHKHLAGTDLCEQLYMSQLDLELHTSKDFWLDIVKRLWYEFRSFPLDKADSHPLAFSDILNEEWGAAFYSRVWSRMIAADVCSAFHEVRGDQQKIVDVGKRFRDTFLALGGSSHPSKTFRKFRGRDPSPRALLTSLGLKKIKTEVEQ